MLDLSYNDIRSFFDELSPFLTAAPIIWGVMLFFWVRLGGSKAAGASQGSGTQNDPTSKKESELNIKVISAPLPKELPAGITSETATIIRMQINDRRHIIYAISALGVALLIIPSTFIYKIIEININDPLIASIIAAIYVFIITKYIIIPNSDIAILDSKFRFGVQLTVRDGGVHFISFDTMEAFIPEPIPGARISSNSKLVIVEKNQKGFFSNRVALRLSTVDGWIDLISIPTWLFYGDWREQFSAFSSECTKVLQAPRSAE